MELQGFPHKGPEDKSYVAANEMLKYLEDYADHFDLKKHIKVIIKNNNRQIYYKLLYIQFELQFHHHVKEISPLAGDRWNVTVIDLQEKIVETLEFDGVVICIG